MDKKLIICISGASGAIYAERLILALLSIPGESWIVISPNALRIFREELGSFPEDPEGILDFILEKYQPEKILHKFRPRIFNDTGADIASGSQFWDAQIVIPCSMKTLASIANGFSGNLIERCADVTLKEKRKLILVPRETPVHSIHLKNMTTLSEMGATILPASPAFYQKPKSLEDIADFIAGKVLSSVGIQNHRLFEAWKG